MKKAFFSKVAGSLLLSAGLLASGVAVADETLTFDSAGNATFGITHDAMGSFTDTFLFSVDPATQAWISGTAVVGKTYIDGARLANYGITDITFFADVGGVRTNLETSFTTDGGIEFYPVEGLSAGNYGFTVSGNVLNGAAGGSYAGTLNVAAPVPEPATYAMLGVGIGLLAFTARRKTNNKLG
ncbi:FxDxF family PEP-CTERM protein [Pseudoduganella chitinolytica]|uniref:FxDxF family PEP-CTERM protein n=1 Tax=Pseudoduganella chitinolytica TaxID=34070 RepID=A0ABY8BH65_9BURK|nr:FxDxF family PEP-CTERM protein [Pseudoduganella chitinolytica]WEF35185.1 FxDxF family PEP-CTERM protein [Pseudoduganella chitinolytica]